MGICAGGVTECNNGGMATYCRQAVTPTTEVCDGVDNDCNGMVDDNVTCPDPGFVCAQGVCVHPCDMSEFACIAGYTCDTDGLCKDTRCIGKVCGTDQVCKAGNCVGGCDGVMCPHGQVCRVGNCVDPCAGITCDNGRVCEDGACQPKCGDCRDCAAGEDVHDDRPEHGRLPGDRLPEQDLPGRSGVQRRQLPGRMHGRHLPGRPGLHERIVLAGADARRRRAAAADRRREPGHRRVRRHRARGELRHRRRDGGGRRGHGWRRRGGRRAAHRRRHGLQLRRGRGSGNRGYRAHARLASLGGAPPPRGDGTSNALVTGIALLGLWLWGGPVAPAGSPQGGASPPAASPDAAAKPPAPNAPAISAPPAAARPPLEQETPPEKLLEPVGVPATPVPPGSTRLDTSLPLLAPVGPEPSDGARAAPVPAETAPARAPRFGDAGEIVFTGVLNASIGRLGFDVGGSSSTTLSIEPAFDYFQTRDTSEGTSVFLRYSDAVSGIGTETKALSYGWNGQLGKNVWIGDRVSFWPKLALGIWQSRLTISTTSPGIVTTIGGLPIAVGPSTEVTENAVVLQLYAPFLLHVAQHFFIGFGPDVYVDVLHSVAGISNRRMFVGASSTVGGWK